MSKEAYPAASGRPLLDDILDVVSRRLHPEPKYPWAAAVFYFAQGWTPVRIPRGQKGPRGKGWQSKRFPDRESVHGEFARDSRRHPCNVGLVLGEASGGLFDVDVDCNEARDIAAQVLPKTDRIHGREGNPGSHYWYYLDELAFKTSQLLDPVRQEEHKTAKALGRDLRGLPKCMLVELRGQGGQTMVPPSIHPESQETLSWEREGEPQRLTVNELWKHVSLLASLALFRRYWPSDADKQVSAASVARGLVSL